MNNFVKIKTMSGREQAINANLVKSIKPAHNPGETVLIFEKGSEMLIKGDFDDIVNAFNFGESVQEALMSLNSIARVVG